MIDAKLLNSIQVLALKAIEDPDTEDVYRQICRWYSREFSTPLTIVEDMDPIYVLRHYFEIRYRDLRNGSDNEYREYEKIKLELIFPDMVMTEEKKTDDWIKQLEEETRKVGPVEKKSIDELGKKLGTSMASTLKEVIAPAAEELNLITEDLQLPDSGSFGEGE